MGRGSVVHNYGGGNVSLRPRVLKFLGLLLVACLALGATAGAASAKRYTAKQKKAISHQLLKQIKKNPKLLRSKSFVRKASAVNFQLPVTIRLNPDLVYPNVLCGALGSRPLVRAPRRSRPLVAWRTPTTRPCWTWSVARWRQVRQVGRPSRGLRRLQVPARRREPGRRRHRLQGHERQPDPRGQPVSVLTNPDVTTKTVANGGCTDRATSPYFGDVFGPLAIGIPPTEGGKAPLHYSGTTDADLPANMPYMNTSDADRQNTVLRASGPVSASNPAGNLLVGINGTKSGGFANILGAGPSQVKLALDLNIWTIVRGVDAERGNGLGRSARPARSAPRPTASWIRTTPTAVRRGVATPTTCCTR